jgi:hypothetical protein
MMLPNCEIFDILDSRYFYTTKSLWVSDSGTEIKNGYFLQFEVHFVGKVQNIFKNKFFVR